jgi:hypothetical protein
VTKRQWLFVGTVVLVLLCTSLFGGRSALTPYPAHQILLAFSMRYGFLVVLPITYLASLAVLWNSRWLGPIVLGAAALFATLSIAWFIFSWDDVRNYQDALIVVFENAIGISLVLASSIVGFLRSARQMQVAAYFGLFAMLSWCAFPYFGELP